MALGWHGSLLYELDDGTHDIHFHFLRNGVSKQEKVLSLLMTIHGSDPVHVDEGYATI